MPRLYKRTKEKLKKAGLLKEFEKNVVIIDDLFKERELNQYAEALAEGQAKSHMMRWANLPFMKDALGKDFGKIMIVLARNKGGYNQLTKGTYYKKFKEIMGKDFLKHALILASNEEGWEALRDIHHITDLEEQLGNKYKKALPIILSGKNAGSILLQFATHDFSPETIDLMMSMPYVFESRHGSIGLQLMNKHLKNMEPRMAKALEHSKEFKGVYRTLAALKIFNKTSKKGKVSEDELERIHKEVKRIQKWDEKFSKHGMKTGVELEIPHPHKKFGVEEYQKTALIGLMPGGDLFWEFELPPSAHFIIQQKILHELTESGLVDREQLKAFPLAPLHINISNPKLKKEDADLIAKVLAASHASDSRLRQEQMWQAFMYHKGNRFEYRVPHLDFLNGESEHHKTIKNAYYLSLAASKGTTEWKQLKKKWGKKLDYIDEEKAGEELPSKKEIQPYVTKTVKAMIKKLT